MPVITEGMLRKLDKEGQLEKVHITEKDILTPSAREFLNVKKIDFRIKRSQDQVVNNESDNVNRVKDSQANTSEEKAPPKRQYKDYITGATYDKKPEFMTQLFGNELVVKNHKIIVLRGKFDIIQADVIR